ncbi:hypothetical protein M0802_012416 [Mischocyttarus mexicanus]|nr:hypothetical protein M0802_012416 [Mischocyttarus mexicanus]
MYAIKYRFNKRKQLKNESARLYAFALQQIITRVNPDSSNKAFILNQFVNGLTSDTARRHMRQIKKLTLDYAILVASQIYLYEKGRWMNR